LLETGKEQFLGRDYRFVHTWLLERSKASFFYCMLSEAYACQHYLQRWLVDTLQLVVTSTARYWDSCGCSLLQCRLLQSLLHSLTQLC